MKLKVIALAFILGMLAGCGEQPPPPPSSGKAVKPDYSSHQTIQQKRVEEEKPGTDKEALEKKSSEDKIESSSTVDSVINYGTGATHMRIKKKTENKLKMIQEEHNRQLEEALE